MKKWMPLKGNFTQEDNEIVFEGLSQQTSVNPIVRELLISQTVPDGIVLYEDVISNGTIEATIEFEKFDKGDLAQIIFNYGNDSYYMCAGVANTSAKYGFNLMNGQLNTIYATGFIEELSFSCFDLNLQLFGSFLRLSVNGIQVFTYPIPGFVYPGQVGIWVKSNNKIRIHDFKTASKEPEVFIVSQFGTDYDILYDEVIRPVCKKLKYNPVRGDEVVSCSMILSDIITSIRNSTVIIADITPDNPNVFYEIGYAHALNKPTILLCERKIREKLPFDISGFRTIFYDNSIGGKRKVEERLEQYLQTIGNMSGT